MLNITHQRIKQFKEAFSMMDADGDGKITEQDLRTTLGNLGEPKTIPHHSLSLCKKANSDSGFHQVNLHQPA